MSALLVKISCAALKIRYDDLDEEITKIKKEVQTYKAKPSLR